MCDPQRTRPSSVLQAEYFYHNEPDLPSLNNARPRASNRPPRPSRPVVSDMRRENDEFDSPLNKDPVPSRSSHDNRTRVNGSLSHRQPQRSVPGETSDVRIRSNGSPLSATSNNNASTNTRQGHRHMIPAAENDDSYENAPPRRETPALQEECSQLVEKLKSEKFVDVPKTENGKKSTMSKKSSTSSSKRYSNGPETDRGYVSVNIVESNFENVRCEVEMKRAGERDERRQIRKR